jgi:endonuclease/exonuclease/phosphatase family metal-dependent hydrolase
VRLISWNVQWCRGIDGTVDPARIAREARRLADPDVLCLQEINVGFADLPGSSGENEVQALEREFPGYHVFFASAVDVPGSGTSRKHFGNLIASRFPVGRVMRHSLPWPKANGPSMPRAALEAVIHAPFGALRVITTHLEYYSSGHRAAQIERLRELHCETNHETASEDTEGPFAPLPHPQSALVCGDFNMPPDDPLRTRFLEAFVDGTPQFRDGWQVLHRDEAHPHTFRVHERKAGQSPYCCDYVFVTEDLAPRLRSISIDADNRASDHQPVIVELA